MHSLNVMRVPICSFLAVRLPNSSGASTSLFVFCCPEAVPVRAKMTMSSSKVVAAADDDDDDSH